MSMISAFRSLDTSNYPLQFIDTKLSYNQLDSLNLKVEAANVQLKNEGVFLTQSSPDPESGTVVVDIKQPSTASFSELATARGSTVTAASYTADVSGILQAKFGSSVTLGQETAVQAAVAGRDNDFAPFYDGDGIVNLDNGIGCTGGFNVLNQSGQPAMLTDGHCGSGQWATTAEVIGNTTVNWHSPTSGYDIQAISEPIEGIGSVWTDYGNRASVTGTAIPAKGDGIVVNGAVTQQKGTVVNSVDVIISRMKHRVHHSVLSHKAHCRQEHDQPVLHLQTARHHAHPHRKAAGREPGTCARGHAHTRVSARKRANMRPVHKHMHDTTGACAQPNLQGSLST